MYIEDKINELTQGQLRILELLEAALGNSKPESKKWYSNEEASRLFGVSKRTLANWRDSGKINFSQIGAKIYYASIDIDDFMSNHSTK